MMLDVVFNVWPPEMSKSVLVARSPLELVSGGQQIRKCVNILLMIVDEVPQEMLLQK